MTTVKLPISVTNIGRFSFAADDNNTSTSKCNLNFTELTNLANVGSGAFYNAKMDLQSVQAPVSRADAATPVTLDLSNTKISSFAPNAFAFNSSTPISTLNLPTGQAIVADGLATNAFTFPTTPGSIVTVTGGNNVTAAQMQTIASMLPTGTNLAVTESSVS